MRQLRTAHILGVVAGGVVCIVVGAAAGKAAATEGTGGKPPGKPALPTASVARGDAKITVDGKLDEPAWKKATQFKLAWTLDGGGPAGQQTTVLLLRDAANLHVAFRCVEPRMDGIRPGLAGKDVEIWQDDSVEVFLGPSGGGGYFHFGVNVAGGTIDGRGKDDTWNLPLQAATAKGKWEWTAEMALPLAKLVAGHLPMQWVANFHRTRYATGDAEEYAWSPTFSEDSHVPERFGKLVLGEPPASQAAPPPRTQPGGPPKGQPGSAPPQAKGLKAFHRAGQTFLTWDDSEDSFGEEPVTWGQIRGYFRGTDAQRSIRYRIYRHSVRIDATTVKAATLVAEVAPLSGFNVNSWSLERLIDQSIFSNDDRGELGIYGPFKDWNRDSPQGGRLVIPRLAIEDGKALPPGRGLHVHSAAADERAYYAVTASAGGVENLAEFSAGNSLAEPVAEAPTDWQPVEQPAGKPFGFDFRGTRRFYVTWVAPPLASRPISFNWSVLIPPDCDRPAPVELYFHEPGYSYARPPVKFLDRSIQICPHDWPFSGWYGYLDSHGEPKEAVEGVVRPYTIRRIEAFLKWAQGRFPVDVERIIPVGGDGAALMALYRPKLFAFILITDFDALQLDAKAAGQFVQAWGPSSPRIKDEAGRGEWGWGELDRLLCGRPMPNVVPKGEPPPQADESFPGFGMDLPLFVCRGYSWGRDPAYGHGRGRFYYALQATRQPLHAHWAWGGKLTAPGKFDGLWQGLDITNTTPVLAITNSTQDKEGEGSGHTNTVYTWGAVKEDADAFEAAIEGQPSTFDLTPRRLSKLKVRPGEEFRWEAFHEPTPHWARREKPQPKSGTVKADAHGLITLAGLETATGYKLVVRIRRGSQVAMPHRSATEAWSGLRPQPIADCGLRICRGTGGTLSNPRASAEPAAKRPAGPRRGHSIGPVA